MKNSTRLAMFGKIIYDDIIDENRFNNHYKIINYLNTVVDKKYKLEGDTYLKVLLII